MSKKITARQRIKEWAELDNQNRTVRRLICEFADEHANHRLEAIVEKLIERNKKTGDLGPAINFIKNDR